MTASARGVAIVLVAACSFRAPAGDRDAAPSPGIDAPPDAAADAVVATDAGPFVCDFPAVKCPGNQPLRILPCGPAGECWVGCVNGDVLTPAQAMQFCTNLGMTIGAFDSAAQETCVRNAGINGSIMLGITQLPNQANDDEGWVRIADNMPLQYVNWDSGQPNDGPTPGENNEEQCAYSSTSSQWQDMSCTIPGSARWICRHP